jgi:hypothetical protein
MIIGHATDGPRRHFLGVATGLIVVLPIENIINICTCELVN